VTSLFEVKLSDDEVIRRLKGNEKAEYLNKLTTEAGRGIAEVARKRMSDMLKPGHKYNVGASGRASENLEVKLIKSGGGLVAWAVIEGDKTPANEAIRKGIKRGQAPSISDLKIWVAEKGITLNTGRNFNKFGVVSSYQRRSKLGKLHTVRKYARRVSGGMNDYGALYAIQSALYQEGTQRGPNPNTGAQGAYWMNLPPKGQGRFDYVVWTVKQEGYFEREAMKFTGDAVVAYVDYLASGRKSAFVGKTFSAFE